MHKAFYGKYNRIFHTCANSVYQASPRGRGGEGPGEEAIRKVSYICHTGIEDPSCTKLWLTKPQKQIFSVIKQKIAEPFSLAGLSSVQSLIHKSPIQVALLVFFAFQHYMLKAKTKFPRDQAKN